MRKQIWFIQRLGPTEIVIAIIVVAGIATIGGVWVTAEARHVYAHPLDNLAYTVLVLALYLLFNAVLIGFCCAVAIYLFKFAGLVVRAAYRLLRGLLTQPIRLGRLITGFLTALRRRLSH
ncbi:hypothetical protein QA648_36200 (plasmid) [Rhizobium sp. CB3171]|uniref:hypothetical protein n=1 Tax=Rhizobium sp. CB3171 TaxID=3039157 RepID=UPI0024B1935E|nr:hypothetical protein [Rhizobium sp. CB3171]WFU07326.1 hypothetical protein QA648_36200 [Rhizobium sp. CB3171]